VVKEKILVVDDDADAVRLTSYALELEGYETLTAETGATALETVERDPPNLVILDVMMPDMSGIEVCQRLRSSPRTQHMPIIMLSAKGKAQDKVTGLKAGADDYVAKPTDPAELIARVERMLLRAAQAPAPRAQVLALVGAKGGVGTTTVAVNLGVALARLGTAVVLLDIQPFRSRAMYMLGLSPESGLEELAALESGTIGSREVGRRLVRHSSGLSVLGNANGRAGNGPGTFSSVHAAATLQALMTLADWVLLDLPPSAQCAEQITHLVDHCDIVALVTEPDPVGLACAEEELSRLRHAGVGQQQLGVVLVNRSSATMTMPVRELQEQLSARVVASVPPAGEACLESLQRQEPVVLTRPDSFASQVLLKMAHRLVEGSKTQMASGAEGSASATQSQQA